MKKALFLSLLASSLGVAVLFTGCDGWTTNDAGFNTSEGAGATINFSGYYTGVDGGRAVKNTSAGNIMSLTIQQAGDAVEVRDNQGSVYRGSVGSPGAVTPAAAGSDYSAGALLVQAQINFTGHDNVSAKNISFAGVFHAVAIEDIQGDTTSGSTKDTRSYNITTNITLSTIGTNTITTITIAAYDGSGNLVFQQVTTTIATPSGEVVNRTTTQSGNADYATTQTTTYSLTEANTQYRLQGTWVEEGGKVSAVDALSPASAGLLTATQ